jgi:hypothetical protein
MTILDQKQPVQFLLGGAAVHHCQHSQAVRGVRRHPGIQPLHRCAVRPEMALDLASDAIPGLALCMGNGHAGRVVTR